VSCCFIFLLVVTAIETKRMKGKEASVQK